MTLSFLSLVETPLIENENDPFLDLSQAPPLRSIETLRLDPVAPIDICQLFIVVKTQL